MWEVIDTLPLQIRQLIMLLQLIAKGHYTGGNDECLLPIVVQECRRFFVRIGIAFCHEAVRLRWNGSAPYLRQTFGGSASGTSGGYLL